MKGYMNLLRKTLLLGAALSMSTPGSTEAASQIVTDGSQSAGLIAKSFAVEFIEKENTFVNVSETNSDHGIHGLINKKCDIALMSREINDDEVAEAKRKAVAPVRHIIALDAITMVVHPANPVNGLTREQIRNIYTGKYLNWKQVGGLDAPIVVIQREHDSSTEESFIELAMGKHHPVSMRALTLTSNREIKRRINATPNAIGFIGHGFVDKSVKTLTVDGIDHTEKTIKDSTYPLHRTLYMYTSGQPAGVIKKFVEFPKTDKGKNIISAIGLVNYY